MRITCFRDAKKEGVDDAAVKEFLKKFNKTEKLYKEGNNWYSTAADKGSDPAGIKWLYNILVISADGFILNATVSNYGWTRKRNPMQGALGCDAQDYSKHQKKKRANKLALANPLPLPSRSLKTRENST